MLNFSCIQFNYSDMIMAHHLEKRWNQLYRSALYRADKLKPIKEKFADMTLAEIESFLSEVIP